MYDEKNLYIKDDDAHTMIIGSTGSGKIQTTLLPKIRLAIKAEESFIVHDVKGQIYEEIKENLKDNKYNTIIINLSDPTIGNRFNPLEFPYKLYKEGKKDLAIELLEKIGYYFCINEERKTNVDPFWTNSAISLFIGLSLYLFENNDATDINLNNLFELLTEFEKIENYIKNIDKTSSIYINLASIVLAPRETKESIISVFIQKLKLFTTRENLSALLSTTDFDIEKIKQEKTALFIISNNNTVSRRLIPLIIEECYQSALLFGNKERRLNILLDEFENLIEINDFANMLTLSRNYNIRFNIYIRSFLELKNTYGIENAEILKLVFGNIIYLLANDIETIEEISKMCGKQKIEDRFEPLITPEELKLLDEFEAIVLIPRINPIRTKLLPDYKLKEYI